MELIPIIQESLIVFIGVLVLVILISYIGFKFNPQKEDKENLEKEVPRTNYIDYLSQQNYSNPVQYIEYVPEYSLKNGIVQQDKNFKKSNMELSNRTSNSRFTVINNMKISQNTYYKPEVQDQITSYKVESSHQQRSLAS